jgi:hypothetical protein
MATLVFIGCYTKPMGHIKGDVLGEGVYTMQMQKDGSLIQLSVTAAENPSFVCSDGRVLYAVHEVTRCAHSCSFMPHAC